MQGSIKQRSKGSWRLRYDGPPDASGKRTQVSETVRGTRKDADAVLRERLTTIERGTFMPKRKETVGTFLERWLEIYAASNTTLRTQQGYRGVITRYIIPAFGGVLLQSLRPDHIQALYSGLLGRGLSPRTVLHVHRVLRGALSQALKWGVVIRNVADAATPPRPERAETIMWGRDTVREFLEVSRQSRFHELYQLALLTGMRRSELVGLKWDQVDLPGKKLAVVATLQHITGRGLVEGKPKTAKSRRSIAFTVTVVDLLRTVRSKQIERRLAAGPAWQEGGHVFSQADGSPVDPDAVTKDFSHLVRRAGLPRLTLHGLRHAHATLLLAAGAHPKVVSERLGHSNIAVTMDTYSHVLPGIQEAAAASLDEYLAAAR